MDQYKNFKSEDFVWDSFFRQWVLTPTRESDQVWNDWLLQNPEISDLVYTARQTVLALKVQDTEISSREIERIISKTVGSINQPYERETILTDVAQNRFYQRSWFQFAASVLLIVAAGLWLKFYDGSFQNSESKIASLLSGKVEKGLIERVNDSSQPMEVWLEDSSRITLAPKSRISYPEKFSGAKREVSLHGEAFFEISKDPQQPFFVYSNELITKVLGTSFTIKAFDSSRQVTVEVKTGRVSVFAKSDPNLRSKIRSRELSGIVLSPNQKIIFERDQMRMVKTLVEKPQIILPKAQIPHFEFEDTPASEAFLSIGKAYGIDILFDEDLLKECPLTATLDNQTLHEKLSIICSAVESTYEILDGQVIVHSKGCRN
ncbi:FecR family protein [Dyadobacter psychrotolerans]|uniref:FecR family protein n=1 Tax=Dyadobacter psychrotolerans TaxID=2541721 RepID=A0A4R5DX07_9BACT|nr:FecR family protein [Dyadobacter psychrotolerans]TDE17174.1 FecR family protein [Dyadobacter psychrotolerans]